MYIMTKKRLSHTQKLQTELEECKKQLIECMDTLSRYQANGESSFMNSPTYIQLKKDLDFYKSCNRLSEDGRARAKGQWRTLSESEQRLYEDNKAFLEHDGDSNYFIGIIECYREINEVHKYKEQAEYLDGMIQGYKDIIEERNQEIEWLHSVIAEYEYSENDQSDTTTPPSDIQQKYEQAINDRDRYKEWYEAEKKSYYEEKEKSQKLEDEVQRLKLQLSPEPVTDNISDEELETLSRVEIARKASDKIIGNGNTWYGNYDTMEKSELVERLKYVETISDRRKCKISDLKKKVRSKKYDKYSQEDAVTYNAALEQIRRLEQQLESFSESLERSNKRNEELQQKVTELAAATLPPEESIKVVEQNIQKDNEFKKVNHKRKGRPQKTSPEQIALIRELKKNGHSVREIAKQIGCAVGTVQRYLKEQ